MIHQRFPPFLLGVILAAYWGRVLRMAYKARRRTGRAANLLPGEKVGRINRVIWLPVVIVWIVQPFLTASSESLHGLFHPLYYNLWVAWPAVVISIGCLLFSRICWKTMGRHWRMGIDPAEQNALIASGPFRYVRHPIYALSMLMMLASMAMLPSPIMLAAGIVHIGLLNWESRREECHLLKIHGQAYKQYRSETGGFFPRLRNAARERSFP
ncbi:MAG TPA: isoprenylcysteine carboxylmethyltransferase family protein [Humisphaera sp.]|nr:isoprenylcysteine carboxylmethyltransferase family protein [Humisphaera sp.]